MTQIKYVNKNQREELIYNVKDLVMLNSKNVRKKLKKNEKSTKFYFKCLKFFRIIEAELNIFNYKLELSSEYSSIHFNFHVNLLKPFVENDAE